MEQLVDLYTRENMHKILSNWYGPRANSWEINDNFVLLVTEMISESQNCTRVFNLVLRPSGPIGAARSLTAVVISEVKSIIKNFADDEYSIACLKSVALHRKFEVEMAKDGI